MKQIAAASQLPACHTHSHTRHRHPLHHPPSHSQLPPKIIGRCQCRARSCQPVEWGLSGVKLVRLAVAECGDSQMCKIYTSMCQIIGGCVCVFVHVPQNQHQIQSPINTHASVQAAYCWPIIYADLA